MVDLATGANIELRVYDKLDPTQLIDIVNARIDPQYLDELKGPGGGSFKIRVSDQKLAENGSLLSARNTVQVRINNKVMGGWIIKRVANKLIGGGEFADQVLEVSGPGLKEWLKDAVVYPVNGNLSDVGGSRNFNFASVRGSWYNPSEWTVPVNMNRKDAGKILGAIFVANPIKNGVIDNAPTQSPDGYPRAKNGWKNGYMLYARETATKTSPAGKSKYWWDANGWHRFTPITDDDPPPTTPEGGVKYPKAIDPGIVVYGYVNPLTGVWTDVGIDAAKTEVVTNTISRTYWSPSADDLRKTTTANRYEGRFSVTEPAPPGWTDTNPWQFSPKEWPDAPHARWIWDRDTRFSVSGQRAPIGDVYFRREFTVTVATKYKLYVAADNQFTAYMDSQSVMASSNTVNASSSAASVELDLAVGSHVLAIKATNWEVGTAGLLVALMQAGDADVPSSSIPLLVSGDSGWLCRGYPDTAPGWSVGEVLRTLVAEAAVRGVNSMARLQLSFTDDRDSEGVLWPAPIEWGFDLGTDYAEVAARIEELSADIRIRWNQDDTFTLDAFIERGEDRGNVNSPEVVVLRPALNVLDSNEDAEYDLKNALLTASETGWFQTTDSYGSTSEYGRIEGFLNVAGPTALAQKVVDKTFEKMALPQSSTSITFVPIEETVPWEDFFVGDWVLGPTQNKSLVRRRVVSLSLSEVAETGTASYAAEFDTISKDRIDKIERWLKSTSDGTLGGSVANASGAGAQATAAVSVQGGALDFEPYSNTALVGQIIDAANIIDGSMVASDKIVGNTITTELLQADAITATIIRSGVLTSDIINSGFIRTANEDSVLWPARAEMNADGFHCFDGAGLETFTADLFGNVRLAGIVESIDYVQGVSGWHLDSENTQFINLNVKEELGAQLLSANNIVLGDGVANSDLGTNLSTEILPSFSQGMIMYASSHAWADDSAAIGATETALVRFNPPTLYASRWYLFVITCQITPDTANTVWRLQIRYTTTGGNPTTGSTILDGSLADFHCVLAGNRLHATVIVPYSPSEDRDDWRGILTLDRIGGASGTAYVEFNDDNQPLKVMVLDMGLNTAADDGVMSQLSVTGGAAPPPASDYTITTLTKTLTCNWSRSYDSDNTVRSGDDTDDLYQGYVSSVHGNTRSQFGWASYSGLADTGTGAGQYQITITKIEFTYRVKHSYQSAGLRLKVNGYHTFTSRGSADTYDANGGDLYDAGNPIKKEGSTYTNTLTNDSSFIAALKSGSARGLCIGPGEDSGNEWYGYLYGNDSSSRPKIKITYQKKLYN